MSNNIFKQYYSPWRYPSNWIKNIRLFFRRYKWAYQRAKRGFADCDVWNMDSWILNLFHDSLSYLADNHCGYPGNDGYPTDESWTAQLKELAQLFYQANESNEYYPTPAADKWWEWVKAHPTTFGDIHEKGPYDKAMFEEANKNEKKRDADFHRAWNIMGSLFNCLWD